MACGSGAFLVQACRYLAGKLQEAWKEIERAVDRGEVKFFEPSPFASGEEKAKHPEPRTSPFGFISEGKPQEQLLPASDQDREILALRLIAQRCLYGVDKNHLAVEMAKLSLWLLTLAKDKPFEFLDHAIRCGDSLVGITSLDQLRHFSLDPEGPKSVRYKGVIMDEVGAAVAERLKIERMAVYSVEDVQRQEELLRQSEQRLKPLRHAADLLVAASFWKSTPTDREEWARHFSVAANQLFDSKAFDELEAMATKERRGQSMFHWPLEFPEVVVERGGFDAFVGNPPFMHGSPIAIELGAAYSDYLRAVHTGVHGKVNLVAFFMRNGMARLNAKGACGLIVPDSVVEGADRVAGPAFVEANGASFFRVHTRIPWPGDANLFVSRFSCHKGDYQGQRYLNDAPTAYITSRFTSGLDLGTPNVLAAAKGLAFLGVKPDSPGFFLENGEAEELLKHHSSFASVLKPYFNGVDLNSHAVIAPQRYVIDFTGLSIEEAAKYEPLFCRLEQDVKPTCPWNRWWQFNRPAAALAKAVSGMTRFLASARVTKHLAFQFVPAGFVYSDKVVAIARSDWTTFSVLTSSLHLVWAEALGTRSMALRKGFSAVHEAIQEALVNALIHADFRGMGGIVIDKYPDRIEMSNPGSLLVSYDQLLQGGISECRNKSLQQMFQHIGAGDKAGSGIDKIVQGWKSQHWRPPSIQEKYRPDRVELVLPMVSLIPPESLARLRKLFGNRIDALQPLEVQILVTAEIEGEVSNSRIRLFSDQHPSDLTRMLQGLVAKGFLVRDGHGRWSIYRLPPSSAQMGGDSTQIEDQTPYIADKDSTQTEFEPELLAIAQPAREKGKLQADQMKSIILALCKGRFLTPRQLGALMNRSPVGLQQNYLRELTQQGKLQLRYPKEPNHPDQAYTTKE